LSGYGTQRVDRTKELTPPPGTPPPGRDFDFVPEVKQALMLSDPKVNCYDPEVAKQMPVQEHTMMTDELIDLNALWFTYWKKYADEVKVPILYALGEHDWLWHGNKEHAQDFLGCFPKSKRVEGGVVAGAPHTLQWWWGSKGEVFWMGH
jgi:pimeloyl-ACP methyl ester carboxylesterase